MSNIYGPILPLQLDSRNTEALVRAIQTRIFLESDGKLNDFTPSSPLSAIVEGQAFAHAELLYYLNNLPEAFSLQWLRQMGIQRRIGSRAYVDVTFFKTPGFARVVLIPRGTKVYSINGLAFELINDVRILENEDSATAPCRSERWGSVYNVEADSIVKIEKNFAGLELLRNISPASGGEDLETVDNMKLRAFEVMSRRNLTTSNDFKNEIQSLLPDASIVKVLTYEEKEQLSSLLTGNVFVVVGDENGDAFSEANISNVISTIKDKITVGTNVSIIPPEVTPVEVILTVLYDPSQISNSLDFLSNELFMELSKKVAPMSMGLSNDIYYQDILKVVGGFDFVKNVNSLDINLMVKDPAELEGLCAGFSGTEDEEGGKCIYNYRKIINESDQIFNVENPIETYRLYRAQIGFLSSIDSSILTFTYDNLYTPQ